jgi:uncharacterized membrane protein YhaH (DUF805 family)
MRFHIINLKEWLALLVLVAVQGFALLAYVIMAIKLADKI